MVGLDGEKMSKSKGNLVLVSRLRAAGVDPMALRLNLISHHYREDWSWSQDELTDSERRLGLWRDAVQLGATLNADEVISTMRTAMASDLDAPAAVAAVDAWAAASLTIDGDDVDAPSLVAQACDSLLGVRLG
jgi:L-cysteine:1D-myo-inositol 2-amino-2-deoxy-alpha-D-glucopyranoside ligase